MNDKAKPPQSLDQADHGKGEQAAQMGAKDRPSIDGLGKPDKAADRSKGEQAAQMGAKDRPSIDGLGKPDKAADRSKGEKAAHAGAKDRASIDGPRKPHKVPDRGKADTALITIEDARPHDLLAAATLSLDSYRAAGVKFATYEEIKKTVTEVAQAPHAKRADGRADFNSKPDSAKAQLDNSHFRDDRERLSYGFGFFEGVAGRIGISPEALSQEAARMLFGHEVNFSRKNGALVVHERPTQGEVQELEQARVREQVARAERWEAGARRVRTLEDVTSLATPAKTHADPLFRQFEPREPVKGSVPGYQLGGDWLEPFDLRARSDFETYATDWERAHSGILVEHGMTPVVSPPVVSVPDFLPMARECAMVGYVGYVNGDRIYVDDGKTSGNKPTERLTAAITNGLPVYAYSQIGEPLAKRTEYGDEQYLLTTDINGRVLQVLQANTKKEPGLVSVISPVDFFGPALLARPVMAFTRTVASGTRALASEARALAGSSERLMTRALDAGMRGGDEIQFALRETPAIVERASTAASGGAGIAAKAGGALDDIPVLTLGKAPVVVAREGLKDSTVANAGARSRPASGATTGGDISHLRADQRVSDDVFRELSQEMGLDPAGAIKYRSTAATAAGARDAGLVTPTRPGFQTHATASAVRKELGLKGSEWQSVHNLCQVAYRALRARGYARPDGAPYSPGRALTSVGGDLSLEAHAAFDAGWVPLWNAAIARGDAITAGQAYKWLSNAINAVDPNLINHAVQGAMSMRIRNELFTELGLNWNDLIVP